MTTSTVSCSYSNYFANFRTTNKSSVTSKNVVVKNCEKFTTTQTANIDTYHPSSITTSSKMSNPISTKEERQATAEYYNHILDDLRTTYSESEAKNKLDEILHADGFELVTTHTPGSSRVSTYPSNKINGIAQPPSSIFGNSDQSLIHRLHPSMCYNPNTSIQLQSNIHGTVVDGMVGVSAEAWAIFGATRPLAQDLKNYWHNRYADSASQTTNIDLESYMANLADTDQRSVVATNNDIANIVSDLLSKHSITLEPGEAIDIELNYDIGVVAHTDSKFSSDIFSILNESQELYKAMIKQDQIPPHEDISILSGQFSEGERSIKYTFNRFCTYAADEPSTVVVNDFLGVEGRGYTYIKKAGDYFDPDSDSYNTGQNVPVDNAFLHENFSNDVIAVDAAINQTIRDALDGGLPVSGNIPYSEVENVKLRAQAEREAYYAEQPMYDLHFEENPSPALEKPETDHEQDENKPIFEPVKENATTTLMEEKRQSMREAVAMLRAKYSALFHESQSYSKFL